MKYCQQDLEAMTVADLRQIAVQCGYGIRYLHEMKKTEIVAAVLKAQAKRIKLSLDEETE